jgi:hypothetical protein
MATKSGALSRIASKATAAGRVHIGKILKGEETLPEAAGGTFENLLSGSRAASASKTIAKIRQRRNCLRRRTDNTRLLPHEVSK